MSVASCGPHDAINFYRWIAGLMTANPVRVRCGNYATEADEKKSQQVRDYELAKLVAEKVGDALKALPLHEARWVTVGPDSPAESLAGLITAARELTGASPKKAA